MMRISAKLRSWVAGVFRRSKMEHEMDAELRFHLDAYAEDLVRRGVPRQEALRRARIEFGGMEYLKEECREARGQQFVDSVIHDVRYALRNLRRSPAVTVVAVLTLAMGIGANTAIFSLVDTLLLRMLPVENPEQLVQITRARPEEPEPNASFTNPLWEQIRDHGEAFAGVLAWSSTKVDLAQGGAVRPANGVFVSGDYFRVLGVRPAAGRLLDTQDDRRGCASLANISYGFWQKNFGGSPAALGSTLFVDHQSFQIIGVAQAGFTGVEVGSGFDVAVPICSADLFDGAKKRLDQRSWWWLSIMARMRRETPAKELDAHLAVVSPEIFRGALPSTWDPEHQKSFLRQQLRLRRAATGTSYVRNKFAGPLGIVMAVVAMVLVIACANIASLMFARATARSRELALRKALGAPRMRLVRQLLTECLVLSICGAFLGVLFARWGATLLVHFLATRRGTIFLEPRLDGRVLAFTGAVTVLTAVLSGLLPALRSTRVSLASAMKGASAGEIREERRFRAGQWIIASQVALSLLLVIGAGLFLRSLLNLLTRDIGFDRQNVLLVRADLATAKVPPERWLATYDEVEKRLKALPGVVSASRSVLTPIGNGVWNDEVGVDSPNAPKGEQAIVDCNFVSPAYLGTMRTRLIAGRAFDEHDTKKSALVAIVNETMAKRFFPAADALGNTFHLIDDPGRPQPPIQIVGIMQDANYESLREQVPAQAFFPASQVGSFDGHEVFELRTAMRPEALSSSVEEALGQMNRSIPLEFHSLSEQVDDSLVEERLLARLSAFFGALALLLAAIGLYGVLSYRVTQRQGEFGIRMALGARAGSILRLVLRELAAILVPGMLAGIALAALGTAVLQSLLFGLDARDFATFSIATVVLAGVACTAGYLPARRATRVDPIVALRHE